MSGGGSCRILIEIVVVEVVEAKTKLSDHERVWPELTYLSLP
jgi:hypothetical protein